MLLAKTAPENPVIVEPVLYPTDKLTFTHQVLESLSSIYDHIVDNGILLNQKDPTHFQPWHAKASWVSGDSERYLPVLASEGPGVFIEELKIVMLGVFLIEKSDSLLIENTLTVDLTDFLRCLVHEFNTTDYAQISGSWHSLKGRALA